MALLEAARNHANVLETFFVKVFNEKAEDTFVIGSDVEQAISIWIVSFEFIYYFFCQWIEPNKAYVIDILATG